MEGQGARENVIVAAEHSETRIEIKIKTLDSQTYTLKVDKQMPVPALKEQIASVTGVLSEQQRLICRGKVLKDDQLLSAYHVEDGHTLHLVVRQPISPESIANLAVNEPASSSARVVGGRSGPSMVIETFTMPEQGDGLPTEISRIVSAVLGSFGLPNIGSNVESSDFTRDRGMQTEHGAVGNGPERQANAFGISGTVPFGQMHPPAVADSLTTMFQYLSHLRQEFSAAAYGGNRGGEAGTTNVSSAAHQSGESQERFPSPVLLAEVLLSTRRFLSEELAECLLQLGRQLENHAAITDPALRLNTQSNALRSGFQLYNLGAFLLELGRTVMALRLGQSSSEAVVNAGPAVFINSSSPNPLMVQPIPLQWGAGFGNASSGAGNVVGQGFLPRRIDIQIRRGSSAVAGNDVGRETDEGQEQRNSPNDGTPMSSRVGDGSSLNGDLNVRVVPIRTMVAALPPTFNRLPQQYSSNSMGFYCPLLGRMQNVAANHASTGNTPPQAAEDSTGAPPEQQPVPEREAQMNEYQQRIHNGLCMLASELASYDLNDETNDEELATQVSEQPRDPTPCETGNNPNQASDSAIENNEEQDGSVPRTSLLRFLSNLFTESEMHVEEAAANSTASADQELPRFDDEGQYFCNLLHQIMPVVTEHLGSSSAESPPLESSQTERSSERDRCNSDTDMPSSKRQKME